MSGGAGVAVVEIVIAGLEILIPNGSIATLEGNGVEATISGSNTPIELGTIAGIGHEALGVALAISVGCLSYWGCRSLGS